MSQQPAPDSRPAATGLTTGKTKILDLDYKIAGVLCYLPICALNLIFSLVWLNSEPKENTLLRYNCVQSLVLCGGAIVAFIAVAVINGVLAAIPLLGMAIMFLSAPLLPLLGLAFLVLNIICAVNVFQGKTFRIKYVCDVADKYMK
ncbi:MAG TPA: hypothetical protein V6D22_26585 [Candidatus Obscuribacterales bacterium]